MIKDMVKLVREKNLPVDPEVTSVLSFVVNTYENSAEYRQLKQLANFSSTQSLLKLVRLRHETVPGDQEQVPDKDPVPERPQGPHLEM